MREFANWLAGTGASNAIQSHYWVIPTVQTVHIIALAVLFGSVVLICLRILGAVRQDEPFPMVVARFMPWVWGSLAVLLASGLVLIVGEPARELLSFSFWAKMALLVAVLVLTVGFQRRARAAAPGNAEVQTVTPGMRASAVAALLLWCAIIVLGRLIAWDGQVWGGLSPQSAGVAAPGLHVHRQGDPAAGVPLRDDGALLPAAGYRDEGVRLVGTANGGRS